MMQQTQERRLGRPPRERCICGARLTAETVARDARGHRQGVCRACHLDRARTYRRRSDMAKLALRRAEIVAWIHTYHQSHGALPTLLVISQEMGITQWAADQARKTALRTIPERSAMSLRADGVMQEIGTRRYGAPKRPQRQRQVTGCTGCGAKMISYMDSPMCATCRPQAKPGALTPIQADCIARQAQCLGCYHMALVESLRPGECAVKLTREVREALRD